MRPQHPLYALLLLALAIAPAFAGVASYSENFSTQAFMDGAGTTADWNTADGRLALHPFTVSSLGNVAIPFCYGVHIDGDFAYVASGPEGLHIVDVSNPGLPLIVGTANTVGSAIMVDVAGDYAYVADGDIDLAVVDISNPTAPAVVGSVLIPASAFDVDAEGDYVFVAECFVPGNSALTVVDVSDPTSPAIVASTDFPGEAYRIQVRRNLAYVVGGDDDLQIFNVSDPLNPQPIGALAVPETPVGFAIDGDYLFMGGGKFFTVDISDPTQPAVVSTVANGGEGNNVDVVGDYAYVSNAYHTGQIFDIRDPENPVQVGTFDTPGSINHLLVDGSYGYVADGSGGLRVLEVAHDVTPPVPASKTWLHAGANAVALHGNYAFMAAGVGGLQVVDISDPLNPTRVTLAPTGDFAEDVVAVGDRLFVADRYAGMRVVDISDPTAPSTLGCYQLSVPNGAEGVAVQGERAYVTAGDLGLLVIDVSDPTLPALLGSYTTTAGSAGGRVAVDGAYAYVPAGNCCLEIVDIADPASPALVGTYTLAASASGVALAGRFAYVECEAGGLDIVDVGDPANPTRAALYAPGNNIVACAVAGDRAFVAEGDAGVATLDISDPANPVLLGRFDTRGSASGVCIAGDYAFVADGAHGGMAVLQVFERHRDLERNVAVSTEVDTATDVITGARLLPGDSGGVKWELSADGGAHWQVFPRDAIYHDFSQPGVDLRWRATLLYTSKDVLPVVDNLTIEWLSGTTTGAGDGPAALSLEQNHPNPFNPSTVIPFTLPEPGRVRLRVYDASGELVATLIDGLRPAGRQQVAWDGRGSGGQVLASGIYFCRLEAAELVLTRKMILLK